MDAPPVQYVKTSDDLSIAYVVYGAGRPLLHVPHTFQHLELVWQESVRGPWLEALASRFRLVTFDHRGTGLSQRGLPSSYVVTDKVRDLESVADHLRLDHFVLMGTSSSAHTAVRYAAEHPERVDALILISPSVQAASIAPPALFRQLSSNDWNMFVNVMSLRGRSFEEYKREKENRRRMVNAEDFALISASFAGTTIEAELGLVDAPALVIRPNEAEHPSAEECAEVAARIRGARMVIAPGGGVNPGYCEPNAGIAAIEEFLAGLPSYEEVPTLNESSGMKPVTLSRREAEVLGLLASGLSSREIAEQLTLSVRTVERHIGNIYFKTGTHGRVQATAYAIAHRLT